MIKKYENKSLLLNCNLHGKKKGDIIKIRVDKNGTPIDRCWRDRMKDAKIDNCVELVQDKKTKETLVKKSEKESKVKINKKS